MAGRMDIGLRMYLLLKTEIDWFLICISESFAPLLDGRFVLKPALDWIFVPSDFLYFFPFLLGDTLTTFDISVSDSERLLALALVTSSSSRAL